MKNRIIRSLSVSVNRKLFLLAAGVLMSISACGVVLAQDQVIYSGDQIDPTRITIGSWGSGLCEESSKNGYGGSRSLRITSGSLYEGGRLDFAEPLDLTAAFINPNAYFQLIVKVRQTASGYDELTAGFAPPTYDDYETGLASSGGRPVNRVRLFLVLEGGAMLESQADLSGFKLTDGDWVPVSFPFAVLKGKLGLQEYKVKRLVIAGDGTEPFFVGEIGVITDRKPIQVYPGEDQFVAAYDDVMFRADCDGGASALKYAWDFDSGDGVQEDTVGEVVYHQYRKPGEYTVTLTVSDMFGVKKPAVATLEVTVYD